MKNNKFLSVLLAVIAVMTSCQKDDFENSIPDGQELVIEINGDNASTRVSYSGWATSFDTNDQIGVYCWNGSSVVAANVPYTKQSDGTWTTATATRIPYNASYTYFCYFPYRSDHNYTPGTSGDADTRFASFITDTNNRFWNANQSTKANYDASNLMVGAGSHVGSGNKVRFAMGHKRGLAVFTGEAADATFTGNIPFLISITKYFLMKPSISTSFTDDEGTYSLSAASGKYVSHSVSLAADLSMVDNAGNPRASMTTANCYLVHKAGNYKIPLVYGNAIKNGGANSVAYAPGGTSSDTYTTNFVNHAGNKITGPWITKSGSGVNAGMGLTAASAELLWQDVTGLISAVSVDGDYLKFTVGTFAGGNALIAVKDGSGNILWSWHIWATDETLVSTTAVNTGSHTYNVAAVNLGWVPTGGDGKQGYCPYYQWGRKDPFIPCNGTTDGSNKAVYNISGTSVTGISYSNTGVDIATNIKNPTIHYYYSSNNGPVITTYYNMWDAQNTAINNVASATKKTIYDPCPPGFCVPTGNLYCYMADALSNPAQMKTRKDTNWDSTNKGKTWTLNGANLYFPALGVRRGTEGTATQYVGNEGYCYSATPYSTYKGRYLNFNSNYWMWMNNWQKAYGFCIRPVSE